MQDRGNLTTECSNPKTNALHTLTTEQAFDLINSEDATIAGAVARERASICRAIDLVVHAFREGGRLIYIGAGTSGRLGVLDATECPPTFLTERSMVQGIIAGGLEALTRSIEGAEDLEESGAQAIEEYRVSSKDVVFAIATGGTTPYVHGAIAQANRRGASTVFFACVPADQVADDAKVTIRVVTGPEVLTGSTRMKAGTATKMVLNMITTIAMVRLGKVYGNLMVDVNTKANQKLTDRGVRIIEHILGLAREGATELLARANGHVKTALVMHARNMPREQAEALLADVDGQLAVLLDTFDSTCPP